MKHSRVTAGSFALVLSTLAGIAATLVGALPARGVDVPFTEHVISTVADGPITVFATDVDGDGDTDVLSASILDDKIAWYENNGGSPPIFTERVISTTADGAISVFATDMDGDGDTDVLSASQSDDKIAWYENDGGSPPIFTEWVISTTADEAIAVFATDMDGDGDTDVLSASYYDHKIAWYESDGGSPPSFTERVISTAADGAFSVFATDVDGDGDIDVLSASELDDKVAWYESDGGLPPTFTERVISIAADGATSVFATDVDGDGDTDVLSASWHGNKIAWYESDGGSPPSFTERVLSRHADDAVSVFATDVDGDGDTDVLSASAGDDRIAWYESDGGSPPTFTERVISRRAREPWSVFATDLDGDGDTDVLATSPGDDRIVWYENRTPICGNGVFEAGEECDGGLGCTDCLCDADFEPTAPPSLDCQPTCGNGGVDPGEECDGMDDTACPGACLSDCTCGPFCGNGSIDPGEECDGGGESATCDTDCTVAECGDGTLNVTAGEECDGGLDCTDCLCDADFGPTAPPSLDCLPPCGNGSIDPGEECDGMDDKACPGACLSDCTCGPFCGNGGIDPCEECDDAGESATCDTDCTVAECGDGTLNGTAGEECEGGLGCTGCVCDADFEPTAPPSLDCYPPAGEPSLFSMKAVRLNPTCTAGDQSRIGEVCGGDRQCDTGPFAFDGQCGGDITPTNTVSAEPGDIIVAEVFGSNWSPDGQRLRAFQFSIDEEGFTSGCGTILPYAWDGPPTDVWCETDANCPAGMWCDTDPRECKAMVCSWDPNCPPEWPVCRVAETCTGANHDPKRGAFVDEFRLDELDWIFTGCEVLGGIDVDLVGYRYGWLIAGSLSCAPTYTVPKYFGTLVLVVPDGACGTFTIPLLPWPYSAMVDVDNQFIEPIKTEPLTITICGDGMVEGVEACDNGLGNSDTLPDACRTTCVLASCGDGVVDTGEECDGMDDTACPGACLNDCTCCLFCRNGVCDPGEDSCNCPDDCGTPPSSEVLGATCADGNDNDCDGLTDSADPDCGGAIPTVSAWGLTVMALLLLAGAKVYFGRKPGRAGR